MLDKYCYIYYSLLTSSFETSSSNTASKANSCFSTYSVKSTWRRWIVELDYREVDKKFCCRELLLPDIEHKVSWQYQNIKYRMPTSSVLILTSRESSFNKMTNQVLTLSFVSWTVRKLEFDSVLIMSCSFFAISFLFSGLLRTCNKNYYEHIC